MNVIIIVHLVIANILLCTSEDENNKPLLASFTTLNVTDGAVKYDTYEKAAIATDSEICSKVGKDILKQGGSAVDGAIAAIICLGVIQIHSTGIGGGAFMAVYKRDSKEMFGFDFRETVPKNAKLEDFDSDIKKTKKGGLAVAVPSEVKGLREAWRKFGKLEWKKLIEPSITIAEDGFPASPHMVVHAKRKIALITEKALRSLLTLKNGSTITEGTIIKRPAYAQTLKRIKENPEDMYEGELAQDIVNDIKTNGGVMTLEDLRDYKVNNMEIMKMKLDDLTLQTLPLPSGGPLLIHMLMMGKEFNFSRKSMETMDDAILTYHRVAEIFKFSHAYRSHLCDPDFIVHKEEFEKILKAMLDPAVAKAQCKKIDDTETKNRAFYQALLDEREDHGTTHVSLLAENGDAVAVSSSINDKFGALFSSEKTGIVYNNQIADSFTLSSPWRKFSWSEENSPRPGSRPLSAMVPVIITDENGDVRMVIGGSGGSRITLSVAWVIMMKLWFGMDLGNAVVMSRPYQTFHPDRLRQEKAFPINDKIIEGLKKKKHKIKKSKICGCGVIQAIYRHSSSSKIFAKSDPRKHGKADGY